MHDDSADPDEANTDEEDEYKSHDHEHEGVFDDYALSIRFEIHSGMTHVHFIDAEGELTTFFVDSDVDDEEGIIAEVMEELAMTYDEGTAIADRKTLTVPWEFFVFLTEISLYLDSELQ